MKNPETPLWQTNEGQNYLNYFKGFEPQQFAVIKVGGELIDDASQLEPLAQDLATLWELGLYPVVVHGGGPQIDKGLKEADIVTNKVGGVRVTSAEAAALIPSILAKVNADLCSAINTAGSRNIAEGITDGVFAATLSNPYDLGSVNHINTNIGLIVDLIKKASLIPVISCSGRLAVSHSFEGGIQSVNINGDKAAVAMAGALVVEKFISLTSVGAILDQNGQPFSALTPEQVKKLSADGTINSGMNVKALEKLKLFDFGVHDIVITSPKALLKELFTNEGAGTIIHSTRAKLTKIFN